MTVTNTDFCVQAPVAPAHRLPAGPHLEYSSFPSVSSVKSCKRHSADWSELVAQVRNAKTYTSKKQQPLIKLATFGDRRNEKGTIRHDGNVEQVFGVEADYDAGAVTPEEAAQRLRQAGIRAVIYTSASHTANAPRWRVLAPLSAPVEPGKRHRYISLLNGALGGVLAPESWVLSQTYYFGRVEGVEYEVHVVDGEPIDCVELGGDLVEAPPASRVKPAVLPTKARSASDVNDPVVAYLHEHDWVTGVEPDGRIHVRCPWESGHSVDSGPSSTTYLPGGMGGFEQGHWRCLHASCAQRTDGDFFEVTGWSAHGFPLILTQAERDAMELSDGLPDGIEVQLIDADDAADVAVRQRNAAKARTQAQAAIDRAREAKGVAAAALAHLAGLVGKSAAELRAAIAFDPARFDALYCSSAWSPDRAQLFCMTPAGNLVRAGTADAVALLREHFDAFYDSTAWVALVDALEDVRVVERKYMHSAPMSYLVGKLKAHRQFGALGLQVDMFATQGRVQLADGRATLIYPHRPLAVGAIDQKLLDDYRAHFDGSKGMPTLDATIETLVAARFASNRKRSHVWLQAESDWGKSFFMSVLRYHGLVCETSVAELDKVMAGGPVGLTVEDMRRVWVLAVDEFKGVTREVKQLAQEITFSPKGMPRVTVPLFLKVFMSAEDVPSLASDETGVEAQFAKRFMHWRGTGRLAERKLFTGATHRYFNTVAAYVGQEVNRLVSEYVAMGPEAASNAAEVVLARAYKDFAIGNAYESLDDKLAGIGEQFKAEVIEALQQRRHSDMSRLVADQVFVHMGVYWLRRPQTVFKRWAELAFSKSESGKVAYKAAAIVEALGGTRLVKYSGAPVRALSLGPVPSDFDEVGDAE